MTNETGIDIIADRLLPIKASPTIAVSATAREYKAKGLDVISLSTGEPDFDTADNVKERAIQAIHDGETKYTAVGGTPKLKDAIINASKSSYGIDYERQEVIVGAGAKQVIFNALLATLNPSDEVIIPAPYWVSYPDMVRIAQAKPVIVDCNEESSFKNNSYFIAETCHR